jgi:alginate O-acetyltransferase complex protein AlgJ
MMKRTCVLAAALISLFTIAAFAAPFVELAPKYNRVKSRAMVRKVQTPTLANLDYAAYTANPILFDPKMPKPKMPGKKVSLIELSFDNLFSQQCDSLNATPLTAQEKELAMAWKPLVERLWKVVKEPKFIEIGGKVAGKKWDDPAVAKAYQEIAAAYIHDVDGNPHLWVKVEFMPWAAKLLDNVNDEDKDGFPEFYAEISLAGIDPAVQANAYSWMKKDYLSRTVTREEAKDWITVLASYWYPTYNTDVMDMGSDTLWPNKGADKKAISGLKRMTFANPLAVIKGNPYGKIIYNVYLVEELTQEKVEDAPAPASQVTTVAVNKALDASASANSKENSDRLKEELKPYGTYEAWARKMAATIGAEKDFLAKLPPGQMGFKGKDDWIFFRKSLEYMAGGDLNAQAKDKNPIPHLVEFKKWLADQNVNMLFVPVPNKEEVYYDKLPFAMPKDSGVIVNPYSRKFIKDAQDAGIEVIDLLPLFLKAKAEDKFHKEQVYQRHDTHWTNRGLQIAAAAIADRVKQYSWYSDAVRQSSVKYSLFDTTFMRLGDIVDKLPETDRAAYPEDQLEGQQVKLPGGKLYNGTSPASKGDPIMLIGDSFTGVFESIDCKGAGVGAHIAANLAMPVDIITSWGGGPLVRDRVVRARKNDMGAKRLVIYLMVARDLYNYAQNWTPLKFE